MQSNLEIIFFFLHFQPFVGIIYKLKNYWKFIFWGEYNGFIIALSCL